MIKRGTSESGEKGAAALDNAYKKCSSLIGMEVVARGK
jgi:hypothetical protein